MSWLRLVTQEVEVCVYIYVTAEDGAYIHLLVDQISVVIVFFRGAPIARQPIMIGR